MSKAGKIWGETEEIFNNGAASIHYLKIKKGGFCSEHYHQKKFNKFFIAKGNLLIKVWKGDGFIDETVLWEGESTVVDPGVYHQFIAQTDVECIEIYYLPPLSEDIFRRTTGGMKGK